MTNDPRPALGPVPALTDPDFDQKVGAFFQRLVDVMAWFDNSTIAPLLGTVSMDAQGVPDGSGFEVGENASGSYVRLASGHMICRLTATSPGGGGGNVVPLPAEYPNADYMILCQTLTGGLLVRAAGVGNRLSTSFELQNYQLDGQPSANAVTCLTFGRWTT